jgi:hypothetical protein
VKNSLGNNLPVINLHKKKSHRSEISSQLLYGDNFKVIKTFNRWKKIKIKKRWICWVCKKQKIYKTF